VESGENGDEGWFSFLSRNRSLTNSPVSSNAGTVGLQVGNVGGGDIESFFHGAGEASIVKFTNPDLGWADGVVETVVAKNHLPMSENDEVNAWFMKLVSTERNWAQANDLLVRQMPVMFNFLSEALRTRDKALLCTILRLERSIHCTPIDHDGSWSVVWNQKSSQYHFNGDR